MSPNTFLNINNGERDRYAAFAEWEAQWNPQWLSQLGLRYERVNMNAGEVQGYNPTYSVDATAFNAADREKSDNNFDLTALARYAPNDMQTVEFGFARKTRSPNLYERYTWSTGGMAMLMINMAGDGNGYVGNLDLEPEIAHTLSATFDWHDATQRSSGLKITPYYTYVDDYIDAQRCPRALSAQCNALNSSADDRYVILQYVNQRAMLQGIDLSGSTLIAQHADIGKLYLNGMASYVDGRNLSTLRMAELEHLCPCQSLMC